MFKKFRRIFLEKGKYNPNNEHDIMINLNHVIYFYSYINEDNIVAVELFEYGLIYVKHDINKFLE